MNAPVQTPWRCFHCDEVFHEKELAAEHFGEGNYEMEMPICIEAATTEQMDLVRTNREIFAAFQKAEGQVEDLEFQLDQWNYLARRLTKQPSASTNDLDHAWDFMQGQVLAAEAAINAAPRWLAGWLRRRAERAGR